ncbi:MAG: LptF/LptG family permease [Acidobacteria bacterium]|nr:MAG: LptF/LptG family permease [Acidobacteriota bacterium]
MRLRSRLSRYVSRQLQGAFFLALTAFTAVFLLNFLFRLASQTIERRVPFRLVVGFVLVELPEIFLFTMPMAAVIAVLVGIGRLAVQHELLALEAAGISRTRIFRPVLGLALLGALAASLLAHGAQPYGRLHRQDLVREIIRARDVGREIDPGVFYQRLADAVLYARGAEESAGGRIFTGILLYLETPRGDSASLVLARRGRAEFDRESGRVQILLEDGEQHSWEPGKPEDHSYARFAHYTLSFPPDPAFRVMTGTERWDAQEFLGPALVREIASLRDELAATTSPGRRIALERRLRKARIEWHRRLSLPLAILVLSFTAFPLAARSRRGGRFAGLTQGILIIVAFALVHLTGRSLAEDGRLDPAVGLWLANAATLAWGVVLWLVPRAEGAGVLGRLAARLRVPLPRRAARATEAAGGGGGAGLWGLLFSRLDRYLAGGFLRMLGAAFVVLVVLGIALDFRRAIVDIDESFTSFPWRLVLSYVALSIPEQLQTLLPIGALAAAGISLSALARAGELVAMKASGIGTPRIAAPLLASTLALCGVYGLAQETLVPAAAREARTTLDTLRGRATANLADSGRRWIAGSGGRMWAYIDWSPSDSTVIAPSVFQVDLERARLLERLEASRATFSGGRWEFHRGWRRLFAPDGTSRFERFGRFRSEATESPDLFGANRAQLVFGRALADQLTARELWRHTRRMRQAGFDVAALQVGLFQKVVRPLVPFLLVLVGIPLVASGWARKGSLYGFGIALMITLAFWALWAVSSSLGREGVLSPVVAGLMPPGVLAAAGTWLLARAR